MNIVKNNKLFQKIVNEAKIKMKKIEYLKQKN